MADGFRIHHRTARAVLLLVHHPGGPNRGAKDYHLRLDANGDCIVSETVWRRLNEAAPGEFLLLNTVANPPAIRIDMGKTEELPTARLDRLCEQAVRSIAPRGVSRITIGRN